jgi:2-polyprenyl-6-methoxyphenol hydroxylase-like FAD-dependent oxidoreductase
VADIERILITGGGIAGLSLATALHRQGFAAELVERSKEWPAIGAGINLPANGIRALRALGVGKAVEQAGALIRRWGFFDQMGEMLCDTDLEELWGDVGPCIGIERVKLHQALLAGAAGVPSRLAIAVASVAQANGTVFVGFSDGSSGDYNLVVGADGIYSTVGTVTMRAEPPEYAGQMVWRSISATRPEGVTNMMVLLGDNRYFGLVPMGDGRTYGFGVVGGPRFDDPLTGRLERFRPCFEAFGGPVPEYLASLECDEQLHFSPIEWVDRARLYSNQVVLIGDAAHAGPPHMGEGGCMAMEDALVLAEVLRSEHSIEKALRAYVTRRRPRTDWVQQQSRVAAQAMIFPPAVRNSVLRERGDQMMHDRFGPLKSLS